MVLLFIRHIHQSNVLSHLSNLEASKLKLSPVVRELAQESVSRLLQLLDIIYSDLLRVLLH